MNAALDRIVPEWDGPARVHAFFTTLDVGSARATDKELAGTIGDNRRRLRALLPSDPVWLSQVHGRDAVGVNGENAGGVRASPPQADAAFTRTPGIVLSVRTADCLPVLLADRAGSIVAVAHAGWRGLAAGVLEAALDAMGVPGSDTVAWIGPAIGPRAFEVGADVRDTYCGPDPELAPHFVPLREGKWLADLPALARRRLAARGVLDVTGGTWCTYSDSSRFHSYRRDKGSGRMALVAWLAS
jgi:YfiH family protein